MKSILYLLIATALITIVPFLTTFENGQDIVRGLFDFSILIVLVVYLIARDSLAKAKKILIPIFFLVLFVIGIIDLQNILSYKGWATGWRIVIPFATSILAIAMLKPVKALSTKSSNLFLFVIFFAHMFSTNVIPEQPILEFPIANWLLRTAPNNWTRNNLTEEIRSRYNVTDSVTITRYHVDTTRSNVVVLVESWGFPMDSIEFNEELTIFNGLLTEQGVHFRMYSRTRTAEREDLLDSAWRDSTSRDSLFMPKRFAKLGYTTTFLFGGDSAIQWRYKYIRNIGFQNAIWTNSATADIVMAEKIDSLLEVSACDSAADSTCANRHFIAWTTRDTRFPISDDPVETEKLYYERLFGTLKLVADLAKKHPEVRFVVQGDHEPILSPLEFQAKFYRRWVPHVVLN